MEDEQLVRALWARDPQALATLRECYGAALFRLARNLLGSDQDAEECVNDALFRAWNAIPPQHPRHLFAYLAVICRNLAFNRLRWKNAVKRRANVVELTQELEQCLAHPGDERREAERELGVVLSDFLRCLPKEQRLVFLRRYWFADSIREIAQRYGLGESRVKTMLFRTRRKLSAYLEREGISL